MASAVASAAEASRGHADAVEVLDLRDARRSQESRRSRPQRRRPRFAIAAAACLAVVVGVGGYAYASGHLVGVTDAIDAIFHGAPAATEVRDKVGHPVDAAATNDGVTISADAVVGDDHSYAIVYSIRRDDGEPFGQVGTDENGTLTIDGRHVRVDLDQSVTGATGQGGGLYLYDADPADGAIQAVMMCTTDASLVGATVRTHVTGIGLCDDDGVSVDPLATGSWDLTFALNYESDQVTLTPAGALAVAGVDGTVQTVSASPIGVWVEYTVAGVEEPPETDGMWSPAFLELGEITVTMRDGTSFSVPSGAGGETERDGVTSCQVGAFFDRVVDPAQVASVSFGGVTATA